METTESVSVDFLTWFKASLTEVGSNFEDAGAEIKDIPILKRIGVMPDSLKAIMTVGERAKRAHRDYALKLHENCYGPCTATEEELQEQRRLKSLFGIVKSLFFHELNRYFGFAGSDSPRIPAKGFAIYGMATLSEMIGRFEGGEADVRTEVEPKEITPFLDWLDKLLEEAVLPEHETPVSDPTKELSARCKSILHVTSEFNAQLAADAYALLSAGKTSLDQLSRSEKDDYLERTAAVELMKEILWHEIRTQFGVHGKYGELSIVEDGRAFEFVEADEDDDDDFEVMVIRIGLG